LKILIHIYRSAPAQPYEGGYVGADGQTAWPEAAAPGKS
jgi:hypothetical protein